MENKNPKDAKFDAFLNKTIIFSSKWYFRNQMKVINNEKLIVDDDKSTSPLKDIDFNGDKRSFEKIDNILDLSNAIQKLSAIEQAVIFLLYKKQLSQDDAAKILEICSKSVSRIKVRALDKLKKYLEGDL